jgi:hypothetical protein
MNNPEPNTTNSGVSALKAFPVLRIGEDGKPIYNSPFFVELAQLGRETWNRWRSENPDIQVTFTGVDFDYFRRVGDTCIDFSGFDFGDRANFHKCRFGFGPWLGDRPWLGDVPCASRIKDFAPGMAKFAGAAFGDRADFSGANFGMSADLSDALFGAHANFSATTWQFPRLCCATFGEEANFSGANFGDYASLACALFAKGANFTGARFGLASALSGATFGEFATFSKATFRHRAHFSGTAFGDWTDFSDANFQGDSFFDAMSLEQWRQLIYKLTQSSSSERREILQATHEALRQRGAGLDRFGRIKLARARFRGNASFSGRRFQNACDFTGAIFRQPPDFGDCEGAGRIDFYGAKISFSGRTMAIPGWTTVSEVAVRLRTFRTLAEDTKNHDLERDLYIEERKAERGILFARYFREGLQGRFGPRFYSHCLWIAIMGIYWLFADYGRSFIRPVLALTLSVFVFHGAYSAVLKPPLDVRRLEEFKRAVTAFTVANAVPFVGALTLEKDVKAALLCDDRPTDKTEAERGNVPVCVAVPSLGFQILVVGQSIVSAVLLFFTGLALRNYFKLR